MKNLNEFIKEAIKDFEDKFIRRSVFGVAIEAIDNFNGTAEKQVKDYLETVIRQTAELTIAEGKVEKKEIKKGMDIYEMSDIDIWNAAITEQENKYNNWLHEKND